MWTCAVYTTQFSPVVGWRAVRLGVFFSFLLWSCFQEYASSSNVPAGTVRARACFIWAAKHCWTKTAVERYREKEKNCRRRQRKKDSSPLQQSCSHCAKPSRVRYQFTLKLCLEKSTWPPSPRVSLSHTHTFTLLTYIIAYYHLNCCVFLFCCHRALDTLIPLFLFCTLSIFSHTYLHYVCLPLSSHWELVQIPWRGSSVEHSCS